MHRCRMVSRRVTRDALKSFASRKRTYMWEVVAGGNLELRIPVLLFYHLEMVRV